MWFQDEARFGQQNTTTRIWAKTGSRPRVVRQQQYEYAYLFGAVCPTNGSTEALIAPYANSDVMLQHLRLISNRTEAGRHAVVIMDGAGWHQYKLVENIPNITIIKLPPYSPELNPVEQIWSWLRQHCLANRKFKGYDDIVEACSDAWNEFRGDIKRVISISARDWAKLT